MYELAVLSGCGVYGLCNGMLYRVLKEIRKNRHSSWNDFPGFPAELFAEGFHQPGFGSYTSIVLNLKLNVARGPGTKNLPRPSTDTSFLWLQEDA